MMRRWTHFHSLGVGAGVMALSTTHLAWLLTIIFAAGLVVGMSWHSLKRGAHAGGALLAARVATEVERAKNLRASRRVKLQGVKAKRAELDAAYKRGYIEAKLDS